MQFRYGRDVVVASDANGIVVGVVWYEREGRLEIETVEGRAYSVPREYSQRLDLGPWRIGAD